METTTIKRITAFRVIEEQNRRRSSYLQITARCEIYNKKADMVFQDSWKHENVDIVSWRFITGDEVVDSQTKVQDDFEIFKALDIKVDNSEVIAEAKQFFIELEKEKKEAEEKQARISRANYYDTNIFLQKLKPALEAKGYKVSPSIKKEDYINNGNDIQLLVETNDGKFTIRREYHGWVEVSGHKIMDVRKVTKSIKIEKIVDLFEETVEYEKRLVKNIQEKTKRLQSAKQVLESVLGIEVECKKEWHSSSYNRRGEGYYTEHFIDKKYCENGYSYCPRFTESSKTINGKPVKGFTISHLPIITDMEKLKKIYDLLKEE